MKRPFVPDVCTEAGGDGISTACAANLRDDLAVFVDELDAEMRRLELDARRSLERGTPRLAADLRALRARLAKLRAHAQQLLDPQHRWEAPA